MNRQTFGDAVKGRRGALSNELGGDDELSDDEEARTSASRLSKAMDGEEAFAKGVQTYDEAGFEIEAFNLNDEREEGHFDATGNFVFAKGKKEEDAWLSGMNEAEMERGIGEAMEAKKQRENELKKKAAVVAQGGQASPTALKKQIIAMGDPFETVAEALQRLSTNSTERRYGDGNRGFTRRERRPAFSSSSSSSSSSSNKETTNTQKEQLLKLIDLSDQLLSSGLTSIYNTTFAALKNSLYLWEYRAADGSVYGPYSSGDIAKWKENGYFIGPTAVQMKPVMGNEGGNPRKRQVSFIQRGTAAGAPAAKRSRMEKTYEKADLMQDLGDSDDEEGEKEHEHKETVTLGTYGEGEWVSSDLIDFGPAPDQLSRAERGTAQQQQHSNEDIDAKDKENVKAKARARARGDTIDDDSL